MASATRKTMSWAVGTAVIVAKPPVRDVLYTLVVLGSLVVLVVLVAELPTPVLL